LHHELDSVLTAVSVDRTLGRGRLGTVVVGGRDRAGVDGLVEHADGDASLSAGEDGEVTKRGDGKDRALVVGSDLGELGGVEAVGGGGSLEVSTSTSSSILDVSSHASSWTLALTWKRNTTTIVPAIERNSATTVVAVAVGDVVLESATTILLRTRSETRIVSPRAAALIVIERHAIYEATAEESTRMTSTVVVAWAVRVIFGRSSGWRLTTRFSRARRHDWQELG
jgi:hypothetical protein